MTKRNNPWKPVITKLWYSTSALRDFIPDWDFGGPEMKELSTPDRTIEGYLTRLQDYRNREQTKPG